VTRRWLILLLVSIAPAQVAQERGKTVVMDAVRELGGDGFLQMKDRLESGRLYSFHGEQLSGLAKAKIYTRYLSGEDTKDGTRTAMRERQEMGKKYDYGYLFDEKNAYSFTFRGARPLDLETVARYRESTRRNFFYILRQRLNEPGMIFESRGSEVIDNQPVEVVDIIDANNVITTVYFNRSTKLPIKQVYIRRTADRSRFEEVTYFSKFRDVGNGVKWPFNIVKFRNKEKIYEMYADTIVINQDLPDQYFALPGDMKILPQAR
jgi:hypothetical protein